jgi:hypothetical protein
VCRVASSETQLQETSGLAPLLREGWLAFEQRQQQITEDAGLVGVGVAPGVAAEGFERLLVDYMSHWHATYWQSSSPKLFDSPHTVAVSSGTIMKAENKEAADRAIGV